MLQNKLLCSSGNICVRDLRIRTRGTWANSRMKTNDITRPFERRDLVAGLLTDNARSRINNKHLVEWKSKFFFIIALDSCDDKRARTWSTHTHSCGYLTSVAEFFALHLWIFEYWLLYILITALHAGCENDKNNYSSFLQYIIQREIYI